METKRSFAVQLQILTKRLVLRFMRRPLAELPNIFISAFFLFVYDGALGGVFGGSAQGTPFDFANGNFVNFILPVSIVSASLSGGASGIYLVEDIESGVFKRYQSMPISKWAIILSPMLIGALRVLVQAGLIMVIGKKEAEERSLSVRRLGSDKNTSYNLDTIVDEISNESKSPVNS